MNLKELSDEELMIEFQATNNIEAYTLLVKKYKNPLMNFVHRFTGDYESSADIVQETMIRVFRKKDSFKPIGKFSTWIYTIAGNLARTELQKKKKFGMLSIDAMGEDEDKQFQIEDNSNRPDEILLNKLNEEMITKAIEQIPEIFREIVILRDIHELSYEEIAEITGITAGTVKSRLNRGRSKLQKLLLKMLED